MSDDAPCSICRSTFRGLCLALDAARAENAALRIRQYRLDDAGAGPTSSTTVRELQVELTTVRAELAEREGRIAELERAVRHWRAIAHAEQRRGDDAQEGLRRSYRFALSDRRG